MPSSKIPSDIDVWLETQILIVGGGPVGMFTAYRLGQLGQPAVLIEQNPHTTIYPKMEYTNHRTMEIYRRVGLKEYLKAHAVPEDYKFAEVFATGFGGRNHQVARIDRPSATEIRKQAAEVNDGSYPLEPHMRETQDIYEALLKPLIQKHPLIQDHWGFSFVSQTEFDDGVLSTVTDPFGKSLVIKSKYVIGCDGAGSKVAFHADLQSPRESLPMKFLFIHFKSSDREKLQSLGDFWHLTLLSGVVVLAQDEINTYTLHILCPPDVELEVGPDPNKFINETLGGWGEPFDIKVDEVIVIGKWNANMSIAKSFRSEKGRVFLAGDAAHELTPAGGHGLNSGIQDSYDLTWKLAANLKGWGGDALLNSYDKERRLIAELHVKMVEKGAFEVVIPWFTLANKFGQKILMASTEEGQSCRAELGQTLQNGRWLHEQAGIVLGFRYNGSPIVIPDESTTEPKTSVVQYIPTTWPGGRPPHVFISDAKTSIFDLCGSGFSIVDFTATGKVADQFSAAATKLQIPITKVHLPNETHCRSIWECDVVLVRPDLIVAWRIPQGVESVDDATINYVLLTAVGKAE